MHQIFQYCTAVGLFEKLAEELNNADIIGEYELYVRAAPWKRYPATLVLTQIYASSTVRNISPCRCYLKLSQYDPGGWICQLR